MQRVVPPSRETREWGSCGTGAMRPDDASADRHRLDKWLWRTRLFKTRALAAEAVAGGKVHLNDERVKPGHGVRVGDRLSLSLHGAVAELDVVGLPERRGPAAEAKAHYMETAASAERRARLHEQQRLANLSRPRSVTRPDKRDRRRLLKLHRGQT
jgi:ribosome-associated heat shock protein Hsp15